MLASRVITDYKGRTIQRIFIFPQTRPCKKAWAFALRQVGYRATGKYRNHKIRRAKKMIYRLKHQSCKQEVASDIEDVQNPDSTPQPPSGFQDTFPRLSYRAARSPKRPRIQVAAKEIPPCLKSAQTTPTSPATPFRQTSSTPQLQRLPRSPALLFFRAGKYQVTMKYIAEADASAQIYKLRLQALAARYRVVARTFSSRKRRLRFDQRRRLNRAAAESGLCSAVPERSFAIYEDSEVSETRDFPKTRVPVRWDFMG